MDSIRDAYAYTAVGEVGLWMVIMFKMLNSKMKIIAALKT